MQGVLSVVSHVQFYFSLNLCMMSLQVFFFFASFFLVLVITVDCCKNCVS